MNHIWILSLAALLCMACGDEGNSGIPCTVNADCQSHELCYDGYCTAVQCPDPPNDYKGYTIMESLCDYHVQENKSEQICCPYTKNDCSYVFCCDQASPGNGYSVINHECF